MLHSSDPLLQGDNTISIASSDAAIFCGGTQSLHHNLPSFTIVSYTLYVLG